MNPDDFIIVIYIYINVHNDIVVYLVCLIACLTLSLPALWVSLSVSPGFPLRPLDWQPTDKTLHLH